MGAPFRIIQDALSTGTGTQDFTVSGETRTPLAAFFHAVQATSDATFTASMAQSWGATDGTNEWCVFVFSEDNVTTTQCSHGFVTDACIEFADNAGAVETQFSINSLITGGVRLDIDNQAGSAWIVNVWLAFEGEWTAGTHQTANTSGGTSDETGFGHDPNVLILGGCGDKAPDSATEADVQVCFGFVADNSTSGTQQCCLAWFDEDNRVTPLTSNVRVRNRNNRGSIDFAAGTGQNIFYSFISDGFRSMNNVSISTRNYVGYLAGTVASDPWAGLITSADSGDIGGDYDHTTPNVESVAGMFLAGGCTTGNQTVTGASAGAYGLSMFTSLDDGLYCTGVSEDNQNPTDTASYADDQLCMLSFSVGGSAYDVTFVGSRAAGGFTVDVAQAPATARVFPALVFGPQPDTLAVEETVQIAEEPIAALFFAYEEVVNILEEIGSTFREIALEETEEIQEEVVLLLSTAIEETVQLGEEIATLLVASPPIVQPQGRSGGPEVEDAHEGGPSVQEGQG